MRIIIVGGGVVGSSLAQHLLQDNHKLALIEMESSLCENLSQKLDVQILQGSGSSPKNLRAAGVANADMVVAVTPNDEVNLVVCALDVQFPKPHPEALVKVVDHFSVSADEVVYVGDSQVDEMAAKAAGIAFVAYRNPDLMADYHIRSLAEFARIVGL